MFVRTTSVSFFVSSENHEIKTMLALVIFPPSEEGGGPCGSMVEGEIVKLNILYNISFAQSMKKHKKALIFLQICDII